MRVTVDNCGKIGFIGDVKPHQLPPEAWTSGQNVRMIDGYAEKMPGNVAVYGTTLVNPNWLLPVPTVIDYYWLYASLTKVAVVDSSEVHTNLTRESGGVDVDYTGGLTINWNGGLLNGIPVINNGADVPQMWNTPNPANRLQALTAWDPLWRARCLRPFKTFLFAMDLTEDSVRYPHKVRWSHSADPGTVPDTWDITDTTKDAGQAVLADTGGFVLDCLALRDTNIVYKEDQVWGFQYVGGNQVFRPYRILSEAGMLSRDCATPFFTRGSLKHAVFGGDDIYVHDGNAAESIADKRVRQWVYNQLSRDSFAFSFVVPNYTQREILFCFVPTGQTMITRALPWSWEDNVWMPPRELPGIRFAAAGLVAALGASETWDGDSGTWDSDASLWDDRLYGAAARQVLFGKTTNQSLQHLDQSNQFDGVNMTASLERQGIAFARQTRDGTLIADLSVRKQVKELWPRIEAQPGTQIDIYVGGQDEMNQAISWQGPFAFLVGTHRKINPMVAGRFIAVKFQTSANVAWKMHGYELELEPVGRYL